MYCKALTLIMLSSIILMNGKEVGSLMNEKEYDAKLNAAMQMLKIFKNLSYEDKLRVIGIAEGLLISQEENNLLANMRK